MIQREVIKRFLSIPQRICSIRHSSSANLNIEKLESESSQVEVVQEESNIREEQLQRKRNKSRLSSAHRNIVHDQNPYPTPQLWHHGTLKYLRRAYGKYGQASGFNPSLCWPTKEELDEAMEYERVKYPFTVMEMAEAARQQRKEKEDRILTRQAEIVKKMEKLETWKQEFFSRIAKKENEANAAKQRKERLIEEVKRHFGYTVDPRDERFKEMLEKKEKEQKKALKEVKRKAKEAKMLEKLLKKSSEDEKLEVTAEQPQKQET